MATTYLYKTPSSTGSNTISTFSGWIKKTANGAYQGIFTSVYEAGEYFQINFESGNDSLEVRAKVSSSYVLRKITTRRFRDNAAFYHIVVAIDTTDATAEDRCKIYVNGVRETSFSTNTNPSQNQDLKMNTAGSYQQRIGRSESSSYYEGLMAHVHWVDGTAYQASTFGETDSTSGIWKAKTNPTVTYGTNGFFLKFENSGNLDLDSSGNNLSFTTSGTLTQNVDTPTNNFAIFNRLTRHGQNTNNNGDLLEDGNTVFDTPSGTNSMKGLVISTLGMESGKYYCEIKVKAGTRLGVGICNMNVFNTTSVPYDTTNQSMILYTPNDGNVKYDGDSTYASGVSATTDDILGFALDMDNNHWYIHKNGTYFNSGNPASGSTGTGSIIGNITNGTNYFNHGAMFFFASDFSTSGYARAEFNFGSGVFSTTAVSSPGTNASNIGIFEYDVPTGYSALSTKGLNE